MKLIVGLGNPDLKYVFTRHNTGFLTIDKVLDKLGNLKLDNEKFKGIYTKTKIENEDVIIAKPLTYMNLSGDFIRPLSDFYKIDVSDIIIVYDELAFPMGRIKITKEGSAAGHNGIKSIIQNLGTEKFIKVRIGIGPKPININQADFVLMKYSQDEMKEQNVNIDKAVEAIICIVTKGVDTAMNDYNSYNNVKEV